MSYEIGLFDHNAWAYETIREELKENDKTCIVHATGTGKSFIALQLIYDFIKENPNNKVVYLTPLNGIQEQVKEHIDRAEEYNKERGIEFHREYFDNVEFISYTSAGSKARGANDLDRMTREELSHIKADLLIVDEFHHIGKGAENWKAGVDLIINSNPNIKIFGMSATNVRNKGNNKEEDVAETFFEGNIASEYPIEQAIADGTLPEPNYHATLAFLEDECAELEEKVKNGRASAEEKYEYEKILKDIRYKISSIEEKSVQDIINQYLKADGKYIYFCPPAVDIIDLQNNFLEMIPSEMRDNVEFYQVHSSKYSSTVNEQMAYNFYNNIGNNSLPADGKLRVMFAVDMYNEGIHVPDIDGIIMGRNTRSDIIFYQQLGRALAVKKQSDNDSSKIEPPLVIDLQDNFRKILRLYNKVNGKQNLIKNGSQTENKTTENNNSNVSLFYSFGISDEIIDIVSELDKVRAFTKEKTDFKVLLTDAYNFLKLTGKLPSRQIYNTEEKKLGIWIRNNKEELLLLAKHQDSKIHPFSEYEEEYVKMAKEIERKLKENDSEFKFKTNLKLAYEFFETTGKLPSQHSKNEEEKKLGSWVSKNRNELSLLVNCKNSKIHQFSEYEEGYALMAKELEHKLKENDPEFKFKTNLKLTYEFFQTTGKLPKQHSKHAEENKLGKWASINRNELSLLGRGEDSKKHPFSEYEEEYVLMAKELESKCRENNPEFKFKTNLELLYSFFKQNGRLPNHHSKNAEEKKLGRWITNNRNEFSFLEKGEDSKIHPFSEYEEKYVLIAKTIESKRKENDSESKFKTSLKLVFDFLEREGILPNSRSKNEEEKKLGIWISNNKFELSLLANHQNSKIHLFSEYEEEYVKMAKEIENKRKENDPEFKFKTNLKLTYEFLKETGKLPSQKSKNEEEKNLGRWVCSGRNEFSLLANHQDSKVHPFSEYEEEYVKMAKSIESKRKENDPEFKFKINLKLVYEFFETTEKLPSQRSKNEEEKKLGSWITNNRKEISLLINRQDSKKHPFSEYEEEYVKMAKSIAIFRGWLKLEEAKASPPNEQIFTDASVAIMKSKQKANKISKSNGRKI